MQTVLAAHRLKRTRRWIGACAEVRDMYLHTLLQLETF
jgi:hypothetical protein